MFSLLLTRGNRFSHPPHGFSIYITSCYIVFLSVCIFQVQLDSILVYISASTAILWVSVLHLVTLSLYSRSILKRPRSFDVEVKLSTNLTLVSLRVKAVHIRVTTGQLFLVNVSWWTLNLIQAWYFLVSVTYYTNIK